MPVAAALRSQAAWSNKNESKSPNTTSSHSGGVLKRRSNIGTRRYCRDRGTRQTPADFRRDFRPPRASQGETRWRAVSLLVSLSLFHGWLFRNATRSEAWTQAPLAPGRLERPA